MAICVPFVKDKKNIEWLEKNSLTFIDYLSKNHSIFDIAHTILNADTMDDKYVSNLIKKIENYEKKFQSETDARKLKHKKTKQPSNKPEQKAQEFEEALEKANKEKDPIYELLD